MRSINPLGVGTVWQGNSSKCRHSGLLLDRSKYYSRCRDWEQGVEIIELEKGIRMEVWSIGHAKVTALEAPAPAVQ